jgi:hypothetical protein
MSVNEILEELEHLSPDELKVIQGKIELLHENIEITPEMLEAIEEGRRSFREEGGIPIEQVRKEMGL